MQIWNNHTDTKRLHQKNYVISTKIESFYTFKNYILVEAKYNF